MIRKMFLLAVVVFPPAVFAQTTADSASSEKIFSSVEQMPVFPGGEDSLWNFLRENIQYPETALRAMTEGTVYISFVVDRTGLPGKVKVIRGVGKDLDAEAVRVVRLMPRWKPGRQGAIPVNVYYTLPIKFTLDRGEKK